MYPFCRHALYDRQNCIEIMLLFTLLFLFTRFNEISKNMHYE